MSDLTLSGRRPGAALSGGLLSGSATLTIGSYVAVTAKIAQYPFLAAQSVRYLVAAVILGLTLTRLQGRWPRPT